MSTTSGTKGYYEMLRRTTRDTTSTTSGITSPYEALQAALGGTTKHYELLCESLCGITRGVMYNVWFFLGIFPKIIFQKNHEKF